MRSSLKESGLVAGFVLLAMLLVANALVTWRRLDAQIQLGHWVIHTHDVRAELSQAETGLLEIESAERGYLLTGDQSLLKPYQDAEAGIAKNLDTLERLTADNPVQQKHIAELRPLVRRESEDSARTISQYVPLRGTSAPLLPEQNLRTIEEIRRIFSQMLAEEGRLDTTRTAEIGRASCRERV